MHPEDARRMVEDARSGAAYHLRLDLTRVRTPRAEECAPHAGVAVLEGTVTHVYRSPEADRRVAVGDAFACRIDSCVPVGHPELVPTSPCVEGELLESAEVVEVVLDDERICHDAAIEVVARREPGATPSRD